MTNSARAHRSARRAMTLIEAVMAMALSAIILGSMGAVLVGASRSVDAGQDANTVQVRSADVAGRIAADLAVATDFIERTANTVEIVVPDRDNDAAPEQIRYELSGSSVEMTYNGVRSVIAEDAEQLDFTYSIRPARRLVVGPQQILMNHNDAAGGVMREFSIDASRACAQFIQPPMPANATSWSISGVSLRMHQVLPAVGTFKVCIRTATAARTPTSTILAFGTINETSLPATFSVSGSLTILGLQVGGAQSLGSGWIDVALNVPNLAPGQGVCLVIIGNGSGGPFGAVEYEDAAAAMPFNTHFMTSSNSGSTWSTPSDSTDMRFELRGTITTITP